MQKNNPNQEVEIKLPVTDAKALRHRLKRLGAQEIVPRTYESNTLYDTPSRDLIRKGQLIRIRIEQRSPKSAKFRSAKPINAVLTYKGPSRSFSASKFSRGKSSDRSRFKIREEIEVVLANGEQMSQILRALGLRTVFQYEKFRTTYVLPGIRGLKVEFDETPVGPFLELEGNAAAIDRAARRLGYSKDEYLTSTYGDLYIADCRRRGRKPSNMLFEPTKKLR